MDARGAQMEPLLEKAIGEFLHVLEDAWAGLIKVLVEQEKYLTVS
jgi:hypothetical protein